MGEAKQKPTITIVTQELKQTIQSYRQSFDDTVRDDGIDAAILDLEDNLCSVVGSRPFREVMYIYQQVLMQHMLDESIDSHTAAKRLGINRTTMIEFLKRKGVCLISNERRL